MEILDFIGSIIALFQNLQSSKTCRYGNFGWAQNAFLFDIQMPLYISGTARCAVLHSPSVSQHPENHTQCGMKLCGISKSTDRKKNNSASVHDQAKHNFPPNTSFRHIHLNHSVFLCCFNPPSYRGGKLQSPITMTKVCFHNYLYFTWGFFLT